MTVAISSTWAQSAVEEVTVVARKKQESLQEVPLAITALGTEQIERLNIRDVADVVNQDPSVQFDQGFTPSDTRVTIRGLSPTRGRPNVATLIDGIDISSEAISNAGGSLLINPRLIIVDAAQIEVVKGPQSALYGRNAFAGAVQYVTKDPSDQFESDVSVNVAEYGSRYLTAAIAGPVTDRFGYRISGLLWNEDGIYRNTLTGDKVGGGDGGGAALTLKWEPQDNLDFKLRLDYADDSFDAPAQANVPLNTVLDSPATASECYITPDQQLTGFLRDPQLAADCASSVATGNTNNTPAYELQNYFLNPNNSVRGLGQFDPVANQFQYNDMKVAAFAGRIPDADQLQIALSPNTRDGCLVNCDDYEGITREVVRGSLVANWALENVTFSSYTAFADAKTTTALDIDKDAVINDGSDPDCITQDCASIGFFQNSSNDLEMFSQELRAAFAVTDTLDATVGLYYWNEEITNEDRNNTFIMGGPQCFLGNLAAGYTDLAIDPFAAGLLGLDPDQQECGRTETPIAPWVDEGFNAHPGTTISRKTEHRSIYGQLDWQMTDSWNLNLEARYIDEDNTVTGPSMRPCWYDPDAESQDPQAPVTRPDRSTRLLSSDRVPFLCAAPTVAAIPHSRTASSGGRADLPLCRRFRTALLATTPTGRPRQPCDSRPVTTT